MNLLYLSICFVVGSFTTFLFIRLWVKESNKKIKQLEQRIVEYEQYNKKLKDQKMLLIEKIIQIYRKHEKN